MKKNIALIITLLLITIGFAMSAQATDSDTTITINVVTDENVTASFNTTANGTVNYWIDGIEVIGEFSELWSKMGTVEDFAHSAYNYANTAYFLAWNTNNTLMVVKADVENNTAKIYMLRDEIIAFENDYFIFKNNTLVFKNETNSNISSLQENMTFLKDRVVILEGNLNFAGTVLTGMGGMSLVAIGLFMINRRYPFGEIIRNGNGLFKNGNRQYRIVDFVKQTKVTTKATKTRIKKSPQILLEKITNIRRIHIRRNPKKSPLKLLLYIRKNPEKSLLQSLFPFLFFNK